MKVLGIRRVVPEFVSPRDCGRVAVDTRRVVKEQLNRSFCVSAPDYLTFADRNKLLHSPADQTESFDLFQAYTASETLAS